MLKIRKIDHVAIAVKDIDESLKKLHGVLGLASREREVVAAQKTEAALIPVGDGNLELIQPVGNEGLQKFLDNKGPGLHHVAIEVEGIEEALTLLEGLGVPLIDKVPRVGARGHKVAFVHPKATGGILFELVEPADSAHSPAPPSNRS